MVVLDDRARMKLMAAFCLFCLAFAIYSFMTYAQRSRYTCGMFIGFDDKPFIFENVSDGDILNWTEFCATENISYGRCGNEMIAGVIPNG